MKTLSPARIEAMALAIADGIERSPALEMKNRGETVRAVSKRLESIFGGGGDDLDLQARKRIASLSRSVPEGSREWDVLYRQYIEELKRRR